MNAPSKTLLSMEIVRSIYEYGLSWLFSYPLNRLSPIGDGHPVMVIPGLGTSDGSTHFLRKFLDGRGYETHSWGMGRNLGPKNGLDNLLIELVDKIKIISDNAGGKPVSLIGWSLGGIYAREIAKISPCTIRQVITLGTPFKADQGDTNATLLYELLSNDKSHKNPHIISRIAEPPPVPFTSIYSKTDGVVNWRCSIEEESCRSENIEIIGASHLGLGHNPMALYVIANRLHQYRGGWTPYR